MRFPGEPAMPFLAQSLAILGIVLPDIEAEESASSIGETARCSLSTVVAVISGVCVGGEEASEAD